MHTKDPGLPGPGISGRHMVQDAISNLVAHLAFGSCTARDTRALKPTRLPLFAQGILEEPVRVYPGKETGRRKGSLQRAQAQEKGGHEVEAVEKSRCIVAGPAE